MVVVGAGPGGCAIAYHLSQAGWQVTLVERLTYPVNKLCGEFLSPEGVISLHQMGLAKALAQLDPPEIDHVLISNTRGRAWQAQLPASGIGLTRRNLDQSLLVHCQRAGVQVIQGLQIRDIDGDPERGFYLRGTSPTGSQDLKARLVIGAFGKQSILQRKLQPRNRREAISPASTQLMALKLYAESGRLPGRVELHTFPGGYAGMSEVEGGQINLCLLTKVSTLRRVGNQYDRFGAEMMSQNPVLQERLNMLRPDWSSALAIANLSFGSHAHIAHPVPVVGDAAASISPLCGDGMSMAMRSAELLAPLADQLLSGRLNCQTMMDSYTQRWQREFAHRLRVGQGLQKAFLTPLVGQAAIVLLNLFPAIGQRLIRWTRGS